MLAVTISVWPWSIREFTEVIEGVPRAGLTTMVFVPVASTFPEEIKNIIDRVYWPAGLVPAVVLMSHVM